MATPQEKLAAALEKLHTLQNAGYVAINASELTRPEKEQLIKSGFIKEVSKGWYIPTDPAEKTGDSTSWYSSYWEFCSRYLDEKFNQTWSVSAEQSIQLHAANWSVPAQLIVRSPGASNTKTPLPYETSLFNLKANIPDTTQLKVERGIRMYSLPASLIFCSENTYRQNPIDTRTALSMIRDSSDVLTTLLDGGHSTIAGRLAGAFRNIGRTKIADDIITAMKTAGYDVRESDPFENKLILHLSTRERSPYVNRLRMMWQTMRQTVIENFPEAPGIPADQTQYLQAVEDVYVTDAYHSLSIERYRVTPELIERVRSGQWNHASSEADRKQRDAMAARGYWQAFQQVKNSLSRILNGENPGTVAGTDHGTWYLQLFEPSVAAGLLKRSDLAGYRNHQVYIGNSKHVPLNVDAIRDAMPLLFELLEEEPKASVRVVLSHFIFVYIHPYMDGNGRMGRFLMNAMLASGGYPWTVIPVEQRATYMHALEQASVHQKIEPFAIFLGNLVNESLKGMPVAKI